MLQRLGAVLICASLLTAGCIGSVQAGTAQDELDTADQQAQSFAGPDADLVGIIGFESNDTDDEPDDDNDPHDAASALEDEELGDGEAPAWVYTYQTSNLTYRVTVTDDGEVIANETEDEVEDDRHPIESWSLTSQEAADTVAENNNSWQVGGEGSGFYGLNKEEADGDPVWTLVQFQKDGIVVARVNAETGEYLGARGADFGSGFDFGDGFYGSDDAEEVDEDPEREGGTFADTVTAAQDTNEHEFEIQQDGHPELGVQLRTEGPTSGTVNVTVEGPNGTLGGFESSSGTGTQIQEKRFSNPLAGDYTVTVQLTDGAERDYTLHWCADGEPSGDDEVEEACESTVSESSSSQLASPPVLG